ncbi:arrestin domain-containing protein 3-like [Engraulis encrasicolus]|uniref:arrestin domain-containing protein 3-like n=1 Tax=Engraulis encrasicolus TaxID=184585 RepID=UPI002FD0CD99
MGIEKISVDYDAINEKNTFSNGDYLIGRVTVHVSSPTKIQSLAIKAKGKARVMWSEHYGQTTVVYYDKEKYYSEEKFLLKEWQSPSGSLELVVGRHVYPFSFQLPVKDMPSSFKGSYGKIRYRLTARLSRSLHVDKKTKTNFTFVSKPNMADPGLTAPQYGSKDKDVSFFASGNISMNIFTDKMAYHQGEAVPVIAEIMNNSTRKIVPKFYIYQKQSFFAQGRRRVVTNDILKEKGHKPLESSTSETITQKMTIPKELLPSVLNCRIIKVEYRIKAVLSVSMTRDPQIKLPLIVLPEEHDWPTNTKEAKPSSDWPTHKKEKARPEHDRPNHNKAAALPACGQPIQKYEAAPPAYDWPTEKPKEAPPAYDWPTQKNEEAPPSYDWSIQQNEAAPSAHAWPTNKEVAGAAYAWPTNKKAAGAAGAAGAAYDWPTNKGAAGAAYAWPTNQGAAGAAYAWPTNKEAAGAAYDWPTNKTKPTKPEYDWPDKKKEAGWPEKKNWPDDEDHTCL